VQSAGSSTEYRFERHKVGAWLRRALLGWRARQSLAPTEFARRRTPRLARSANPTRDKKGSTTCCPNEKGNRGPGDRTVQKCKSAGGLCKSEKVRCRVLGRVQITDYGFERHKVGAWLRRDLLGWRARQSLAPTEFARRRTPRLARSANPTRRKEGQHVVLSLPDTSGPKPPHHP